MEKVLDFFLLFLSQFAGGPGPVENNLVRFGLPAVLWAILLYIAWSRQRTQDLPREKLLVWGFGLAFVRELYMFGQMAYRLLGSDNAAVSCEVIQPLEHGLAMAAMIVVAGAFLRYILEDEQIARRYLQIGLGITILVFVLTSWAWPRQLAAYPQIKFHQTWAAWLFHIPLSILMGAAVFLLWQKRGWLRNTVAIALTLDLFSELLLLLNYATSRAYNTVICPIGNSMHILAIPLLGFVYLHEQSIEKKRADEALIAYRDHLEDLVKTRTAEIAQRNASLATQNAVAATLSQSLEIEENLKNVLEMVRIEAEMEIGLIFLLEPESDNLALQLYSGLQSMDEKQFFKTNECACQQISRQALLYKKAITANPMDISTAGQNPCVEKAEIRRLISVPLVSKGSVVGIMTLGTSQTASIQPHKLELLTAIGQQIGMALENARMYKDAEIWTGELSRLQERQRIAANMHDGLAQTLGLLGLRVDRMQALFDDGFNPEAEAVTREIREVVTNASIEVRRSIASLQEAPQPRSSLESLLNNLVEQLRTAEGPEIRFEPGPIQAMFLPPEQTDQVLPVVQEAILNACRHAQAQTISVRLEQADGKIGVTVEDDGCGFDLDLSRNNGDHFGLSIMQARAARIGGEFQIDTSPGKGTRILLVWEPVSGENLISNKPQTKTRLQAMT